MIEDLERGKKLLNLSIEKIQLDKFKLGNELTEMRKYKKIFDDLNEKVVDVSDLRTRNKELSEAVNRMKKVNGVLEHERNILKEKYDKYFKKIHKKDLEIAGLMDTIQ